jgi:hypothetical protein
MEAITARYIASDFPTFGEIVMIICNNEMRIERMPTLLAVAILIV